MTFILSYVFQQKKSQGPQKEKPKPEVIIYTNYVSCRKHFYFFNFLIVLSVLLHEIFFFYKTDLMGNLLTIHPPSGILQYTITVYTCNFEEYYEEP